MSDIAKLLHAFFVSVLFYLFGAYGVSEKPISE